MHSHEASVQENDKSADVLRSLNIQWTKHQTTKEGVIDIKIKEHNKWVSKEYPTLCKPNPKPTHLLLSLDMLQPKQPSDSADDTASYAQPDPY